MTWLITANFINVAVRLQILRFLSASVLDTTAWNSAGQIRRPLKSHWHTVWRWKIKTEGADHRTIRFNDLVRPTQMFVVSHRPMKDLVICIKWADWTSVGRIASGFEPPARLVALEFGQKTTRSPPQERRHHPSKVTFTVRGCLWVRTWWMNENCFQHLQRCFRLEIHHGRWKYSRWKWPCRVTKNSIMWCSSTEADRAVMISRRFEWN